LQTLSCLGRGVLFLGNHLPRHPHGAGIVSAAGAGERALYPVWRHHAGFREGARSLLAAREGAGGGVVQRFFLFPPGLGGWAFRSIYQGRNAGRAPPMIAGPVQQLAARLILAPFALTI